MQLSEQVNGSLETQIDRVKSRKILSCVALHDGNVVAWYSIPIA